MIRHLLYVDVKRQFFFQLTYDIELNLWQSNQI